MYRILLSCGVILVALGASLPAFAGSARTIAGPIEAYVEKVVDGDTLKVRARIWLDHEIKVHVRVKGIDTPELRRPRCAKEREMARKAKSVAYATVANKRVMLSNIRRGKYAGRVIADVTTKDGISLARELLDSGQAKPYRKRRYAGWCEIESDHPQKPIMQGLLSK